MELNKAFVEAVEELIQETKCPICLDFFTNPRSAPCQHNFCEECIWEVIKDNHSECPSCRYPGCNRRSLAKNNTLCNVTIIVRKLASSLGLADAATEDSKFDKVWPPKPSPKKRSQKRGRKSKQEEGSAAPVAGKAIPEKAAGATVEDPLCAGPQPQPVKKEEKDHAEPSVPSETSPSNPSEILALRLPTHNGCISNQPEEERACKRSKADASSPEPNHSNSFHPSLPLVNTEAMRTFMDSRVDGGKSAKVKEEDMSTTSHESKDAVEDGEISPPKSARKRAQECMAMQDGMSGRSSVERAEATAGEQARSSAQQMPEATEAGMQTPRGREGGGEDLAAGTESAKATVWRVEEERTAGTLLCEPTPKRLSCEGAGGGEREDGGARPLGAGAGGAGAGGVSGRSVAAAAHIQKPLPLSLPLPLPLPLPAGLGSGHGSAFSSLVQGRQACAAAAAQAGGGSAARESRPSPRCLIPTFEGKVGGGGGGAGAGGEGAQEEGHRVGAGEGVQARGSGGRGRGKGPTVMITGLKGEELAQVQMWVRLLGGEVREKFEEVREKLEARVVTHVVCHVDAEGLAIRTLKYCCGLLSGARMVTPTWVKHCMKERGWREPRGGNEMVAGCVITQKVHKGPKTRDERGAGTEQGKKGEAGLLAPAKLQGKKFWLEGTFGNNPARRDLQLLLRLAGAEVRTVQPKTEEEMQRTIVICENADKKDAERLQVMVAGGAVVVHSGFVMDSISQFRPQPLETYLNVAWSAAL